LLGSHFEEFENAREAEQGELLTGPGLDQLLNKMGGVLKRASPIRLTKDLTCSIGARLQLTNTKEFRSVISLEPAQYCYDPARTKRSPYAWSGLERYGPYDRESFPRRMPRILIVCAYTAVGRVSQAIQMFRNGISSVGNPAYEKGFVDTFHLVNPEFGTLPVPLFGDARHLPARTYRHTLEEHLARDSTPAALERDISVDEDNFRIRVIVSPKGI
jgi:hypothetical protein